MYRWDRLILKGLHHKAKEEGFILNEVGSWCLYGKRNIEQKKRISYTNLCSKEATDTL
jgi:hypothetical protein